MQRRWPRIVSLACAMRAASRARSPNRQPHDSPWKPPSTLPADAPAALSTKIFSLPKPATRSPRKRGFRACCCFRKARDEFARTKRRSKKVLQHRHFLHSLQMRSAKIRSRRASSCARLAQLRVELRCARSPLPVNTSLSGTLFFSVCWCIRDVVHLDPRVHATSNSQLT
jgi:hypothetical protein